MNKIFFLATCALSYTLIGCSYILPGGFYSDLQKQELTLKKISVGTSQLDSAEIEQLSKLFPQYGLMLVIDQADSDYFIERFELSGEYKDLYKNTSNDALLLDVYSQLLVTVKHKYSQDIVLKKLYKNSERLYPNANFYSQRGWYKAQLQFESQQKMFSSFASELVKMISTYEENS